jgi:hypothetical protein
MPETHEFLRMIQRQVRFIADAVHRPGFAEDAQAVRDVREAVGQLHEVFLLVDPSTETLRRLIRSAESLVPDGEDFSRVVVSGRGPDLTLRTTASSLDGSITMIDGEIA